MRRFSEPPLPQPVPHRVLVAPAAGPVVPGPRLTFIRCEVNIGFAGGNNVGLRHILDRGDAGYVWVLNNDTVVERAEADPAVGLWGSLVRYCHAPDQVQARGGGRYRRWLGVSHYVTAAAPGEERLDYVLGAATLVSARFLREVG